jgi:hypothetical protein
VIATEREQAPFADVRFWHKADMLLEPSDVRMQARISPSDPNCIRI